MDLLFLSVVALAGLALLFDFTNGFMDAANSIATVVATRVMSVRVAVWFSATFNFLAYFFVGTAVANTVAKTVESGEAGVAVVFGALVAAIGWNFLAWHRGIPSSSSHAIIGGLIGAGVAAGGLGAVNWHNAGMTVAAIFVSPMVAFAIAALATGLVSILQRLTGWGDDAKPFRGMQVVSAAAVSFGHGANDAQKTMGIIAALFVAAGYVDVPQGSDALPVPWWVAIAAYAAIALGTVWGGWRIIRTMGLRLTSLNARTGVAANIGATTAIFGATALGVPISTTHAAASSVVGAGTAGRRGTNWRCVGEMAIAWVVTIPATCTVGFVLYHLSQLGPILTWLTLGPLLVGLSAAILWAITHAVGAQEIEAEVSAAADASVPGIACLPVGAELATGLVGPLGPGSLGPEDLVAEALVADALDGFGEPAAPQPHAV